MENWVSGRPEMVLNVIYSKYENGAATSGKFTIHIKDNEGWFHRTGIFRKMVLDTKIIDKPMLTWDKNEFGLYVKYMWHEDDPGDDHDKEVTTTHIDPITGTTYTSKVTIKKGDNDADAGSTLVYYNNKTKDEGTMYSTGILDFWINQK